MRHDEPRSPFVLSAEPGTGEAVRGGRTSSVDQFYAGIWGNSGVVGLLPARSGLGFHALLGGVMTASHDRSRRAAALIRVREELIAERDAERGSRRCIELQPLITDLERTLSRCRYDTEQHGSPEF